MRIALYKSDQQTNNVCMHLHMHWGLDVNFSLKPCPLCLCSSWEIHPRRACSSSASTCGAAPGRRRPESSRTLLPESAVLRCLLSISPAGLPAINPQDRWDALCCFHAGHLQCSAHLYSVVLISEPVVCCLRSDSSFGVDLSLFLRWEYSSSLK